MQEYWDYKFRGINHLCHLNQNITNCQSDHSSIDINIDGIDHKPLTPLQIQWNSYLSIASTIPQVIVLMLNAIFGHKISTKLKILTSLIGIVFLGKTRSPINFGVKTIRRFSQILLDL